MTDRERLAEIKARHFPLVPEACDHCYLITELEAAWEREANLEKRLKQTAQDAALLIKMGRYPP